MLEIQSLIVGKLEKMEDDITDIKVTLTENTKDIKHHISRTDGLQDLTEELQKIVQPLYEEHIAKKAIAEYRKKQREELIYKLKLPGYIAAALAALGTILAFLMRR